MSQVSDLTFLRTFTSGDAAKISKYVNMFLKAAPASLTDMEVQAANGDWKSLKTNAHSLKSQLKYMGVASGEVVAQVRGAEPTLLDVWVDRVLTASSLAEVLAPA